MIIVAYGTAIGQALSNPRTTLEELKVLRDHAASILQAQGDLKGALRRLEREIKTKEAKAKAGAKAKAKATK